MDGQRRHYVNGKAGLDANGYLYQICTFVQRNFMLENFIWTASCAILIIYTLKRGTPEKLWTVTLDAKPNFWTLDDWKLRLWKWMLALWTIGLLDKWMLGSLNTLILNVWKYGGNISARGSFYAFFSRPNHASVEVHVQENYLFSRNSLSKEVALLKEYPNKCPIDVPYCKKGVPSKPRLVRKCRRFKEICFTKVSVLTNNILQGSSWSCAQKSCYPCNNGWLQLSFRNKDSTPYRLVWIKDSIVRHQKNIQYRWSSTWIHRVFEINIP